eukprot:1160973-Pelagomonas_calceolata.AAC.3
MWVEVEGVGLGLRVKRSKLFRISPPGLIRGSSTGAMRRCEPSGHANGAFTVGNTGATWQLTLLLAQLLMLLLLAIIQVGIIVGTPTVGTTVNASLRDMPTLLLVLVTNQVGMAPWVSPVPHRVLSLFLMACQVRMVFWLAQQMCNSLNACLLAPVRLLVSSHVPCLSACVHLQTVRADPAFGRMVFGLPQRMCTLLNACSPVPACAHSVDAGRRRVQSLLLVDGAQKEAAQAAQATFGSALQAGMQVSRIPAFVFSGWCAEAGSTSCTGRLRQCSAGRHAGEQKPRLFLRDLEGVCLCRPPYSFLQLEV